MRKIAALLAALVLCVTCFAGCAEDQEVPASESPAAASQENAETAEPSQDTQEEDAEGLSDFFRQWAQRLEAIDATTMTEQPEVAEGLSALVGQCHDLENTVLGDTATVELPSHNVALTATGSDTALSTATMQCVMPETELENGVTPSIYLFTLGSAALVEVMSGEIGKGYETVNDAVAALLLGNSEEGVISGNPISLGDADFVVSLDTASRQLKLTGTPKAAG